MHDEEIGIIDVQLDRLEEVLNRLLLGAVAIDEVLAGSSQNNLSCDGDLGILFEANGRLFLLVIVEDNSDTGFCDASLTAFVDQVLLQRQDISDSLHLHCHYSQQPYLNILCPYSTHTCDP